MALAMPDFRPKQSARLAATLNSPPLTWMRHSVALRKGTMPGSSRWTRAPRETKSSAASGRMFRPYFMTYSSVVFRAPHYTRTAGIGEAGLKAV